MKIVLLKNKGIHPLEINIIKTVDFEKGKTFTSDDHFHQINNPNGFQTIIYYNHDNHLEFMYRGIAGKKWRNYRFESNEFKIED